MQITRRFTREGQDPFAGISFAPRTSRIVNPNGSVVFEMKDVMVPAGWSQVAVDILAQKYFRRAGIPARMVRIPEEGVPTWLQRARAEHADTPTGGETDSRQVFHRLAGCWAYWGWKGGYFSGQRDARAEVGGAPRDPVGEQAAGEVPQRRAGQHHADHAGPGEQRHAQRLRQHARRGQLQRHAAEAGDEHDQVRLPDVRERVRVGRGVGALRTITSETPASVSSTPAATSTSALIVNAGMRKKPVR